MNDNFVENYLQLVKQYQDLWIEVFEDKKDFVEKYFSIFLNTNSFYYLTQSSTLVSALIACDYAWLWQEKNIKSAYLSGILTNKNFRRQGFADKLIKNTLNTLFKKQYFLSTLIAADMHLVEYYKKFGFISCKEIKEEIFNRISIDKNLFDKYIFVKDTDITDIRYKIFFDTRENSIQHNKNTLQLYNSKEYMRFAIMYQGSVRCIAVGRKTKYFIELSDIAFVNQESKKAMLSFIAKTCRRDVKILPQENRMVRIVDVERILRLYGLTYADREIMLNIKDDIIKENNITVHINDGKLNKIPNSYKIKSVTIQEITRELFFNARLYLMLDR